MSQAIEAPRLDGGRVQAFIDGFRELTLAGKFWAAASALSIPPAVGGWVEVAGNGGILSDIAAGTFTLSSLVNAKLAARSRQPSRTRLAPSRSHLFGEYTHVDERTGESFASPFPVSVAGNRYERLGVGYVIGAISGNFLIEPVPVISINDQKSPNGRVELSGKEPALDCHWVPLDEEMAAILAAETAKADTMSAYDYAQQLETHYLKEH